MERKGKILIFSMLLLGLFLITSVYFASGVNTIQSGGTKVNTTGDSGAGKSIGAITPLDKWTLGGVVETFNFTINNSNDLVTNVTTNITRVNISVNGGFNLTSVLLWSVGNNGTDFNWSALNGSKSKVGFQLIGNNNNMSLNNSANFSVQFAAANGTEAIYEWNVSAFDIYGNHTAVTLVTGIDGLAPRMATVNLSYGTVVKRDSDSTPFTTTTYVRNDTGFNITLTVTDYNVWAVLLIYNNSGGNLNLTHIGNGSKFAQNVSLNGSLGNGDGPLAPNLVTQLTNGSANGQFIRMLNQTPLNTSGLSASAPSYTYTAFISAGNSTYSGTAFEFVFVAFDLYNQSTQLNNSNAAFKVIEDGTSPTVSVTPPSTTTVSTSSSTGVTYVCSGSDLNGTISSYEWTLTKPGGDTLTKTTASATFATTDIDKAGTYQVKCKVTDPVGFTGESSTYEFSAHVTASSSTSGGGGGGSGSGTGTGAATTAKFDADLSSAPTGEATISKQQGRIVTFSLDGQNSHKMTFKEVTAAKVTLIIESTPIEVTIAIGETKQIDVDGDGQKDLELTLVSVKNGVAEIKTKKVAETTLETTTTTTLEQAPTTTLAIQPPAEKKSSLAWLWVVLVIVIIVVVVLIVKGKKKR